MTRSRAGFTLIELLVVLAIITLLLSISWIVYGTTIDSARAAATRTVLVELQLAIDARTSAVAKYNARPLATTFVEQYRQGNNPSPNQTVSEAVALVIVKKNLYRQALPSRLEDLWGYDMVPGGGDDAPLWKVWKTTLATAGVPVTDANPRPTGHRRDLENVELLYLTLTKGGAYGDIRFRIDDIKPRHLRDTNVDVDGDGTVDARGNGIPEFIDDWGNTIRFYNWTHRLVRPGGNATGIDQQLFSQTAFVLLTSSSPPSTPSPFPADTYNHPLNQDTDDLTGVLSYAQTQTGLMTGTFQLDRDLGPGNSFVTCQPFDETNYHTLDTRGISLVISAGSDGKLGLTEPTEATNPERRTAEPLAYSDSTQSIDVIYDNITTRH